MARVLFNSKTVTSTKVTSKLLSETVSVLWTTSTTTVKMTKKRTAVIRVSGNKDLRHGKGTITYTDGSSFTGTWKEDNKSHGILTMPNETKYIGSFFDNKYSGAGKLYLDNGRIIEGQFYNGSLQEHGKITFPNGDVFVGQIDDYMIGKSGVLTYKNGDQYDGTFVEENRSGFGILI